MNYRERKMLEYAQREQEQARIDQEMGAFSLSAGVRKAAYDYAWGEKHSHGFNDVNMMYEELLDILLMTTAK